MAKKFTDKNGDTYVEVKPWYKRWWVWILAIVVLFIIIGAVSGSNDSSNSKSGTASKDTTSTPTSIDVDYNHYNVKESKNYNASITNNDWDGATVKIDKITIYKLSKSYKLDTSDGDKHINGFIKLNMSVKANRDISAYPQQGTANFNSQQQTATGESWDGDINKGAKKSGAVWIPVENLKDTKSISQLRFKFHANGQKDFEDDHDYDINLNLNN